MKKKPDANGNYNENKMNFHSFKKEYCFISQNKEDL